ncbi:cupin domain-containing protein [Belnapia rosea]|uniref:cupin domain-containing protein n=1 Tax=Belnapia rosea TaxID=938405 RepID=UPI00088CA110|nr:cupin domain-containing protein [Belnapia rosea]SDB74133.1 Mannose-6-phosphate isomerase, cupin superfamily [Belnapia rosea]
MQAISIAERHPPANDCLSIPEVGERNDLRSFEGIPGERISIRVHSAQVGGRFSILESVAAPGCATPVHSHIEEEVFYIISGNATFRLGDETHEVSPGCRILIPAGTPHAWINRSGAELRMLAVFAPGGIEDLFPRIGGLPPDQVASLAAGYGTIVLGPPMPL